MSNYLTSWWKKRQAKYYVKTHWHFWVDIFLGLLVIALLVCLLLISNKKQVVNTEPVNHVPKTDISTSTAENSLVLEVDLNKKNVYRQESLTLHLKLENISNDALENIIIGPSFISNNFSATKLSSNSDGVIIKNNKIVINSLAAHEILTADVSLLVNVKDDLAKKVEWSLKANYELLGKSYEQKYNLDTLKVISDLKIKAAAYYHSELGDQLGSGPIPPVVGLPTNYWVFFEVDKADLNNLTVTAKLPDNVTLSNNKTLSAGEFSYNENQKRITWNVKKVELSGDIYQLGFELRLFPVENQIGLSPLLLSNISYLATDANTGEKLSGKLPFIDTSLPADKINKGEGVVLK